MSGQTLTQDEIDALISASRAPGGATAPTGRAPGGPTSTSASVADEASPALRRARRTTLRGRRRDIDVLDAPARRLRRDGVAPARGRVARVVGHEVEVRGLRVRVGALVEICVGDDRRTAEVVSVGANGVSALVLGSTDGIGRGDVVIGRRGGHGVVVGPALLGRVIDATGAPLDGRGPIAGTTVPLANPVPQPMVRRRIAQPLGMGVRVLDGLCTAARGQRIGLFGGSGVGKSTLLGMMARGTAADVNVVALIGERGREVREMIEDDLGPEGLARSIVVVATSDQPPLVRLRAGEVATRIAEAFADDGADVLLLLDSLTRLAMAQRDVGLAAGEPPTARGYTPSVFSMLPGLLERAGPRTVGTVTGFYTVLVDGDDMNDPVADAVRGLLDGHVVLDRRLAVQGHFPAIDPLASLSRLASKVVDPARSADASTVRAALAALEDVRDLVEVGAYVPGTNPVADAALAARADLVAFCTQAADDATALADTMASLDALAGRLRAAARPVPGAQLGVSG